MWVGLSLSYSIFSSILMVKTLLQSFAKFTNCLSGQMHLGWSANIAIQRYLFSCWTYKLKLMHTTTILNSSFYATKDAIMIAHSLDRLSGVWSFIFVKVVYMDFFGSTFGHNFPSSRIGISATYLSIRGEYLAMAFINAFQLSSSIHILKWKLWFINYNIAFLSFLWNSQF